MTDPVFPDLKGRSVFITGGGAGIGAALAEAFLRQGAKVAFCQRSDATPFSSAAKRKVSNNANCPASFQSMPGKGRSSERGRRNAR